MRGGVVMVVPASEPMLEKITIRTQKSAVIITGENFKTRPHVRR